jgi:uncharacterized protein (DUF433 family)
MNRQPERISLEAIKNICRTVYQIESADFYLTPSSIALALGIKTAESWKTIPNWEEFEYGKKDISEDELIKTLFVKEPKSEPLIIVTDETYKEGFGYLINYSDLLEFADVIYPEIHDASFVQPADIILFSPDDKLLTLLYHEGMHIQIKANLNNGIYFPNIVCTQEVLAGSPRLNERRLAVGDIVSLVSSYGSFEEIKKDFELNTSIIKEALLYCSSQQCLKDKPLVYCHNCSLRNEQEGLPDLFNIKEQQVDDTKFVKDENSIYFGSKEEYLKEVQGQKWWVVATELLIDLRNEFEKL